MPIPHDYQEIITTLAEKTDAGLVHWQSDRFTTISVTFEGTRFKLWAGNDEHTDEPFVAFSLQTESGEPLDNWYVEEHEVIPYQQMHQLFRAAQRHVKGVPGTLKKLKERLAQAGTIGDDNKSPSTASAKISE